MAKLSEKLARFIKHYRVDRNATKAATAAGYAPKSAHVTGSRLLKNPKIQAEIAKQDAELDKKLDLSAEWILKRLMWRADFDVRQFYNEDGSLKSVHELDEQTAFALQGMDVEKLYEHFGKGAAKNTGTITKIKYADRDRALELLGRHKKLFIDRVEHSGEVDIAAVVSKARQRAQL
jgi:phage terminase small subunit